MPNQGVGGGVTREGNYASPSSSAAIVQAVTAVAKRQARDNEASEGRGLTTKSYESPAQIVATQNNYDSGKQDALRVSTDASRIITGLAGGRKGRYLTVINTGSFNLVLNNEDASSVAANRIINPGGANLTLTTNQSARLWYDYVTQRWRILYHS